MELQNIFLIYYVLFTIQNTYGLHRNLKYYETLHLSQLQHNIVKRGIQHSYHPYNKINELEFYSHGRYFRLILTPRREVIHSKFKAYEVNGNGEEKTIHLDHESFYHGRVFGEIDSHAQMHIDNGVLTGSITISDETFHIEPSWRHLPHLGNETMIIYKSSDVKLSWEHFEHGEGHTHGAPKTCGYVKEELDIPVNNEEEKEVEEKSDPKSHEHSRAKRQTETYEYTPTKTRCPLLLVADYRFYQEMGASSTKTTINYLISLIDRVHKIYNDTLWQERQEQDGFKGMGFVIKKIVVHSEPTRVRGGETHYNMVREKWDVRTLLEVFSREYSHKDFCLAHLFTDLKFEGGILGLAYVGSPRRNSVGGICTPEYFKNGYTLYLNSGLSSSRNHYGQRVITREADLVTAHEFGHNWGSEHDPDITECSPSASQGGSYLMYTYSVSGYDVNNKRFSPCSLRSIRKVLQAKSGRCFSEPEESFCGNLRVEGDEECDAGLLGTEDNDACCDKNCKLRRSQGAVCSDKNSPCCQSCAFMPLGVKCRDAQYATCEQESRCTGASSECPRSPPMKDGTGCLERGQCRLGKCVPYCETQGLQSCMCDTIGDACKRCCRMSLNETCFPIDPQDILPDGTPCIQGFCNKGICEKTIQDVVERFWDIIEDININKVMRFLKDNIVGAVIIITAIVWIPTSCVISYIDHRRIKESEKKWRWKHTDELIHPDEQRQIIRIGGQRQKIPHVTQQSKMIEKLPETINFPKEEEIILELWKTCDTFQNSLRLSKGRPKYSFYDGPPFATGLPHYGHILAGTIKDIVTRYAYQSGYHVERRFGWDTHGLPVEFEIDKTLNIKGPGDVAKMGIANYNKECRSIVMKYATEWETIVGRIGRWIDFKNDYKTLYPWYMESIWWIFKELYNKNLVYQGVKVMPFSTGCNTPLSNFESGQNYKDVVDPSIVVSFPIVDEPGVSLLAWTTTPWTLPSNLALCCNPTFEYVEVKDHSSDNVYIILESSLELVYKSKDSYTVQGKRKGCDLKGKVYNPPFPYFQNLREKGAFVVLNDTYVTAETGTGIVHQAPYFGEDDYRCCLEAGVITKDQEIVCPIDSCGCFVEPVHDFVGKYVKDADKDIIKYLQINKKLIHSSTTKHSYPYCWRSDTPLIYKAVPSWFIRVEAIKDRLITANSNTYWVPDYVKDKRFGNWLRDARDWAISRNRYWGNPIPLWISEDGQEIVCVGSIAELEELTNTKVTDIHRESIDHLTIPSNRPGCPPLRRVPEVFDCWFESGSMPYAQMHYPFENRKEFEENFPADFIGEGIDQTRGWFYTLLVISTALFGKAPFKNLVANGLILASDGQKMSKRKKNYPDPVGIVNKYGADALRLYLINSPVVRAENLRFKEEGVRDIIKDVFLPWYNAFRFLMQNIERFEREEKINFIYDESKKICSNNIMDRWILSFTQTLLQFFKQEMHAYKLYTVVPHLIKYIDNLTNWYVRMNRKRIKGDGGAADCQQALSTLFSVLYIMVRVNAPFTPFLTEFMFQRLVKLLSVSKTNMDSVHYQMIPESNLQLIDEKIEKAISYMQTIIELGRVIRDRKTIPVKYPLPGIVVIHQDAKVLKEIESLKSYILEELNVKELTVTTDKEKYGVKLRAEPDHKILGARLKGDFKSVTQAIKELSDEELQVFVAKKEISVQGHKLEEQDLRLMFSFTGPAAEQLCKQYEAHSEGNILILLDITPDESMHNEGVAREVINRIQKLRKKAQLVPSDEAIAYYEIQDQDSNLAKVIISHKDFIENATKTPQENISKMPNNANVIIEEMQKIKGIDMKLVLVKTKIDKIENNKINVEPFLKYVNIELIGIKPRFGATSCVGTVLLETPNSLVPISYKQLKHEIELIFGIYDCAYNLHIDNKPVSEETNILSLHKQIIKVMKIGFAETETSTVLKQPVCNFININSTLGKGTILLENPKGNFCLNNTMLKEELNIFFNKLNVSEPIPKVLNDLCGKTLQLS